MDSVFLKICQFLSHPFNCRKVERVHLSSKFFVLPSLISHSCAGLEHFKKKKRHQKWKYYREGKQDFERFLILLNIKMSAKSKKTELNEEFTAMWREEQSFWDVISSLYRDKNEKDKSLKRMSDKFLIFSV